MLDLHSLARVNAAMTQTPEQIDALILSSATTEFAKIALIIAKVCDALEAQGIALTDFPAKNIAERLYILVDHGRLECKGNMRRWRDAEARLIA